MDLNGWFQFLRSGIILHDRKATAKAVAVSWVLMIFVGMVFSEAKQLYCMDYVLCTAHPMLHNEFELHDRSWIWNTRQVVDRFYPSGNTNYIP